jgi:hypothetical protein
VRVEDDRAVVADNEFAGTDPAHQAILVGTRLRTPTLGLAVDGTAITGNRASIAGNTHPYRWIHGHTHTTFSGNESLGRVVGFCEGEQPFTTPFIFVIAVVVADPENPPTDPPPVIPPPDPLPPCPLACGAPAPLAQPAIVIRRLATPPGDDTFSFTGRMTLPHPFAPPLDPIAHGVGIVLSDTTGERLLDVSIPGGTYDPATRLGWKAVSRGGTIKYTNKSATPDAGIIGITIKDLSGLSPGLVQFNVRGRRGAYPVDAADLPLSGLFVLDPPTAETGQCVRATFAGPVPACTTDGKSVRCK